MSWRDQLTNTIAVAERELSDDEGELLYSLVDTALAALARGRAEHGPLDIATDRRTPIDIIHEALQEMPDGFMWLQIALMMLRAGRPLQ